jgi:putative N6-adenine-specific DNA methylase
MMVNFGEERLLLVTCPFGLSSVLTHELKFLGYKPYATFPTGTYLKVSGMDAIMHISLWSRVANKVYLVVAECRVTSFDDLFAVASDVDWDAYIPPHATIRVRPLVERDARLHAPRTLQSVVHKAVITQCGEPADDWPIHEVLVISRGDEVMVLVNSSGPSLHQRWWRQATGEAPLKEHIAAAMILMASWKFGQPLRDPCCGSWTILIEAAMIARNRAPGLTRDFAFFDWRWYDSAVWDDFVGKARAAEYGDRQYLIYGSDLDPQMVAIAQANAQAAGVADTITWSQHDVTTWSLPLLPCDNYRIVTNPPYDRRLRLHQKEHLYGALVRLFDGGAHGVVLVPYDEDTHMLWDTAKKKDIKNAQILCKLYRYP